MHPDIIEIEPGDLVLADVYEGADDGDERVCLFLGRLVFMPIDSNELMPAKTVIRVLSRIRDSVG